MTSGGWKARRGRRNRVIPELIKKHKELLDHASKENVDFVRSKDAKA